MTDPAHPGQLPLQYWLFYVYNDWNNLHEGDWEMIQLNFPASGAREALSRRPTEVGYSQHEGAERARRGDDKLRLVDGTHPVTLLITLLQALILGATSILGVQDGNGGNGVVAFLVLAIGNSPDAARPRCRAGGNGTRIGRDRP